MKTKISTEDVLKTEFSPDFVYGMQNRMVVSFFKYGPLADAYPHKVSALGSLLDRLKKYEETGNTEWLMDVANFAMIEFMRPSRTDAHFRATEAEESPGRILKSGERSRRSHRARV